MQQCPSRHAALAHRLALLDRGRQPAHRLHPHAWPADTLAIRAASRPGLVAGLAVAAPGPPGPIAGRRAGGSSPAWAEPSASTRVDGKWVPRGARGRSSRRTPGQSRLPQSTSRPPRAFLHSESSRDDPGGTHASQANVARWWSRRRCSRHCLRLSCSGSSRRRCSCATSSPPPVPRTSERGSPRSLLGSGPREPLHAGRREQLRQGGRHLLPRRRGERRDRSHRHVVRAAGTH